MIKKSLSLMVVLALILTLGTALVLAQEETPEGEEDQEQQPEEEFVLEDYLEGIEDLETVDRVALEHTLEEYEGEVSDDLLTSVVDAYVEQEMELGQGLFMIKNFGDSVEREEDEQVVEKIVEDTSQMDDSGQLMFQAALELRKLAREDEDGDKMQQFAEEIAGEEMDIPKLKQAASQYRKQAREQARLERKEADSFPGNSSKALEKGNKPNQDKEITPASEKTKQGNKPDKNEDHPGKSKGNSQQNNSNKGNGSNSSQGKAKGK